MKDQTTQRPVVTIRVFAQDAAGRILLLKRANSQYDNGMWSLPGGKIDYCDSPEYTVEKEVMEETRLAVSNVQFLFYQNSPPKQPGKMHCINLYFSCQCTGEVTLDSENSDFAWATPEKALEYEPVFGAEEAISRYDAGERGRI
jgi:8-oxo-dGTP diphosphatase